MRETLAERLERRSHREPNGCIVWDGARTEKGYGVIWVGGRGGRTMRVHRAAWFARHGRPPKSKPFVLHNCPGGDRPACWNLEHLWLGTAAENSADMAAKGRQRNGAKLTPDRVRRIRRRLASGEAGRPIALDHGVSIGTISNINTRHTWRNV